MKKTDHKEVSRGEFGMLQEQVNQLEAWKEGVKVSLENIISRLDDICIKTEDREKKLDAILEKLEQKYAPRWIMTPIVLIGSTVLVALVGAILGLILVQQAEATARIFINLV